MIKGILIIAVLCTAILVLIFCLYRGRTKDPYLQEPGIGRVHRSGIGRGDHERRGGRGI